MKTRFKCIRVVPLHLKLLAWMNIGVQAIFPLIVAFTPAIVGAGSDNRFLQNHNQTQTALQTRTYTLGEGETVASVAKKYRMTSDMLRKLNQFRTFARGFDHLMAGDELDVPVAPFAEVLWDDDPVTSATKEQNNDVQAQKFAGYASQVGGILASGTNSDVAASMARGMASGAASGEVQRWLSRFGTARVQLDADKNFSLKNSQLDLLVPLFEQKDSLVFTQSSIHRTDDRTQFNLGLGYRGFAGDGMLGANTFLDYDLSRDHARLGLGGEYWRDFIRLGVNTYYHLTNWKRSPNLEDYEERPANGWDIRAQAWVPSLPQLGGKLKYEQYYGDEVALFDRENRQKDPHATTVGVNYTPVPLLMFGVEQRQGKSGKSDTRFSMDMNYQMGVPLRQQIHPDAVAAMRSLAGSRYDLVERNNNIVLEYRKKEVIHLKTADLVTGNAGEQKSLGVSVTSKYGLERIDWSASSLLAAGGKIVQNGDDWAVVMPEFHSGAGAVNSYTMSGVAVGKKGNISGRADTQVTVTQSSIDAGASSLSPSAVTLPADGVSQQQLVLKVSDKEGHPVDIAESEISVEKKSRLRGNSNATVSAFSRRAAGEYVMTVTAGTKPESFTLTPLARNTHFVSTDVTLTANNATARVDTVERVDDNAIADGKSQNRFSVTVVDTESNRVPGQAVSLKADNGAIVVASAITEADGTVIVPITSQHAGGTTVTASINGRGGKTLKLTFRPDQNTARIEQKDLSVLPEISVADGKTQKTVTARVTDAKGNAVPDMPVTFSVDNGATFAEKTKKTDTQGLVTTTLTSIVAGVSRVTASVNNLATTKDTIFTSDSGTASVASVNTTATSGIADGRTGVTFRALIQDQNGNPLSGIPLDWKSNKDISTVFFNQTQTLTSAEGIAEVVVTSTRAYSDVVVTASTDASSKSASPFTFVADKQNPVITALSSDKQMLSANGADTAALLVSVTDANGNPLSGVPVTLSNVNRAEITPSHPVTGTDGVASASLTTHYAGEVIISAALNKGEEKRLSLQAMADEQTADVTVTSETASATAGQVQPVTLTATVVDGSGNPVSGASVAWQSSHNQLSHTVSQTNAEGKALVQLTGTQATLTTVTAELYNDHKGSAQVTFVPGEPAMANSQLSVSPQSITADGKSEALASLILRDKWDNPVPGKTVDWSADAKAGIRFVPSEQGKGLYHASVVGISEGIWPLSAQSGAVRLETPLALLASEDSAQIDSVAVSGSGTANADGKEAVTIRTQVKDKNGNTKLKGIVVGWDTNLGVLSSRLSSTDENGVAEITLRSRTAGMAQVSAMLGGGSSFSADKPVNFIAGDISADTSSLNISPASIVAEKESAILSVTARDAEGNLLTGLKDKVSVTFSPDLNMSLSAFSEVSSGVYEATVSGKKAITTQVGADVNGIRISSTAALTLMADNDSSLVEGSISVTPPSATVGDTVTYAAVLSDANGNALGAGIPVTWSTNEGSVLSSQVTRTDDSGMASVTLTRLLAGTASVKLILPSGTTPAKDVIFSAGDVDENNSELTLSPSVIVAGKETAALILTLRDSNGNLLTGKTVSGISDNNNVHVGESQQNTNTPGRYIMTVSSNKAGSATLSVNVGGKMLSKRRTVTMKGDTDSWKLSSVTADKTSLVAGDSEGVTYSATVTDAQGNVLNNVMVSWYLRGQVESYELTSRTNDKGVATTTVRSNTAGLLQMTGYLDADNHIQAANVTVVASDIKHVTFAADKTSIGSDGKDTVTLTASLEDNYGNPVMGKTLIIQGGESLAGFKLSTVKDQQNGRYVATGTATTKGQVILSIQVDGQKVGNAVTIDVSAITPDLRFDNAEQPVTWTRNFTASQAVRGMPVGLEQQWSSSDPSVATVDMQGKLTLLKSGTTRISVYTPGNGQHNQAMASYTLNVAKADPGLQVGTGEPITAVWADGREQIMTASYANRDVQGGLTASYSTKDAAIATVDKNGKLKAIKPGSTVVTVSTPETDQFLAASAEIAYVLNKATVKVTFATPVVKTTDEEAFSLQKPVISLSEEANIRWDSSNTNVVNVSGSGTLQGFVGKGQTRLTLTVLANDYYHAASGYYDVMVYTAPSVSIGSVSYTSKGNGSSSSGTWTPIFTDDNVTVSWMVETADMFSRAENVTIYLKDSHGTILNRQTYSSPFGLITTTFAPQTNFWGKTVHIEVVAKGYGSLTHTFQSKEVAATNLPVEQVGKIVTSYKGRFIITSLGEYDTACQSTYFGRMHHVIVQPNTSLLLPAGKKLISPINISHRIDGHVHTRSIDYKNSTNLTQSGNVGYSGMSHRLAIKEECWDTHYGAGILQTTLRYAGTNVVTEMPFFWRGNGTFSDL